MLKGISPSKRTRAWHKKHMAKRKRRKNIRLSHTFGVRQRKLQRILTDKHFERTAEKSREVFSSLSTRQRLTIRARRVLRRVIVFVRRLFT